MFIQYSLYNRRFEEMDPRKNWVRGSPLCVSIAHPILSQATSKQILHRLDTECQNPRRFEETRSCRWKGFTCTSFKSHDSKAS